MTDLLLFFFAADRWLSRPDQGATVPREPLLEPALGMSHSAGPNDIKDAERCAFCDAVPEQVDATHRQECLDRSCTDAHHRRVVDLSRQRLIRVETCGSKLGVMKFDIPLKRAKKNLESEIWWRIRHKYLEKPNSHKWTLSAVRKLTQARLSDCDGKFLEAGEVVEVLVEGDSKDDVEEADDEVYINATPDADVLGANDDYESRNNRVGYLVSEFIDNSLMALMRKYEHQGWPQGGVPTIRLYMLVSEDGEDVAICIEDDANGITLPDLQRMVKLRAKVCTPPTHPMIGPVPTRHPCCHAAMIPAMQRSLTAVPSLAAAGSARGHQVPDRVGRSLPRRIHLAVWRRRQERYAPSRVGIEDGGAQHGCVRRPVVVARSPRVTSLLIGHPPTPTRAGRSWLLLGQHPQDHLEDGRQGEGP